MYDKNIWKHFKKYSLQEQLLNISDSFPVENSPQSTEEVLLSASLEDAKLLKIKEKNEEKNDTKKQETKVLTAISGSDRLINIDSKQDLPVEKQTKTKQKTFNKTKNKKIKESKKQ